jgi:hypothetical protein
MSSLPVAAVLFGAEGKLLSLTLNTGACKYLPKLRHSEGNQIRFKATEPLRPRDQYNESAMHLGIQGTQNTTHSQFQMCLFHLNVETEFYKL